MADPHPDGTSPAGGRAGSLKSILGEVVAVHGWDEARRSADALRALEIRLAASDVALATSEDQRAELGWQIQALEAELSDIRHSRAYSVSRRIGSARGRLRS